ncbi:MAG: hypothetical protein ACP5VF_01945 [Acidobacteriota bacterium]
MSMMENSGFRSLPEELRSLAERVRDLCRETAVRAYEDAATAGLCHEGAWEAAMDAIRTLDLEGLLSSRRPSADGDGAPSRKD